MATWVIIQGSPRANGKCARVVSLAKAQIAAAHPEDEVVEFDVSGCDVSGCNGCDYCKAGDGCIIQDDMEGLIDALDSADRLVVATPLYYAGVPSQFKAVLDRLQPYFWARMELRDQGAALPEKRPCTLFVVGDGGDPHGFEPAVVTCKSALQLANFTITAVHPLIGRKRISVEDVPVV